MPASKSKVMMDLTVNGQVITGTWTEQTNPEGYYQGSVYHGAIQLLLDPTGHRMTGKWVGFGRDFDLNTGPWTLQLVSSDTGAETMRRYNRQPEPAELLGKLVSRTGGNLRRRRPRSWSQSCRCPQVACGRPGSGRRPPLHLRRGQYG